MNSILLVFIILATMFVSSSVNNIISVTTALDNFFEMAGAPDYLAATMNKAVGADLDETMQGIECVKEFKTEDIIYMAPANILRDGEPLKATANTQILQSDRDMSVNYFLEDNSILNHVEKGDIYMFSSAMENKGLKVGDKITIEIEGVSREFTLAGGFKDAVLGSNMMGMVRYIISAEDYEDFTSNEMINTLYGGNLYYIKTSDMQNLLSELEEVSDSFIFTMTRELLSFSYIFDMIVTGILLVVSGILIAVAFVVLRFTITFTFEFESTTWLLVKIYALPSSFLYINPVPEVATVSPL